MPALILDRMAVSCQLYSPGGSVRCSQMPRGSLYDRTAVRCQLLFPWRVVRVFADARGRVRGSQVPALFPWRVCELFTDARGGSFDHMAVRCQLLFLWRVREGIRRCQRGSGARFPTKWLVRLFCVMDVDSSLPEYGILSVSSQPLYSISLKAS